MGTYIVKKPCSYMLSGKVVFRHTTGDVIKLPEDVAETVGDALKQIGLEDKPAEPEEKPAEPATPAVPELHNPASPEPPRRAKSRGADGSD